MLAHSNRLSAKDPIVAFVAVGSNISPERNITEALRALRRLTPVKAISTFYRTPPLKRPNQSKFINGVWKITTTRSPEEMKFDVLRRIEKELGRDRTEDTHAPRSIDLDLILYGDEIVEESDLHIPDPDIRRRPFIAIPLLELAPDLTWPNTDECLSSFPVIRDEAGLEPLDDFSEQLKRLIKQ
ncbi:MAG: 2-amino-4-hydroxy-6-hydroxymethyldihydropteridine diphosphokinase [Proteobacteria bacterium]|nr:2-amino-4-hydroxy-6-hydroxymethyldihydropteridine diphosphokinase [Pseudomonadota bacterium]